MITQKRARSENLIKFFRFINGLSLSDVFFAFFCSQSSLYAALCLKEKMN